LTGLNKSWPVLGLVLGGGPFFPWGFTLGGLQFFEGGFFFEVLPLLLHWYFPPFMCYSRFVVGPGKGIPPKHRFGGPTGACPRGLLCLGSPLWPPPLVQKPFFGERFFFFLGPFWPTPKFSVPRINPPHFFPAPFYPPPPQSPQMFFPRPKQTPYRFFLPRGFLEDLGVWFGGGGGTLPKGAFFFFAKLGDPPKQVWGVLPYLANFPPHFGFGPFWAFLALHGFPSGGWFLFFGAT